MLLSQTLSYMAERVVGTGSFGVVFQVKLCLIGSVGRIRCLFESIEVVWAALLDVCSFLLCFSFLRPSA